MAELIREFLKFYRLDYSLAIYEPETNLKGDIDRDGLAERAGLRNGLNDDQPILLQLLDSFQAGGKGSPTRIDTQVKKVEPLKFEVPEVKGKFALD